MEALEKRVLLSTVELSNGVLSVLGLAYHNNHLTVDLSGTNLVAKANNVSKTYPASSVRLIRMIGGNWWDRIIMDSRIAIPAHIEGRDGSDYIAGGAGNDTIYAGNGNDTVFGNGGDDVIFGHSGKNYLDGGTGNDRIDGGRDGSTILNAGSTATLSSTSTTSSTNVITRLTLYNAETNKAIMPFTDGMTLNYSQLGTNKLSVLADIGSGTRSVRFALNGQSLQIENVTPYAIVGDWNGDLAPWTPAVGSHRLVVTPYTERNAGGSAGQPATVNFTVTNGTTTSTNVITRLTLYNAETNKAIMPFTDGMTLNYSQLGTNKLSVLADIGSGTRSVRFALNGQSLQIENVTPYAIVGDWNGDLAPWTPAVGSHRLVVTPYTERNAGGSAGQPATVNFTVTNGTTTSTNVITRLTLYNAETNKAIMPFTDGMVLDYSKLGTNKLSVLADIGSGTRSVRFALNGQSLQIENVTPYAIVGDWNGDLAPWTPAVGSHRLVVTPYTERNAGGTAGQPVTVNFSVTTGATLSNTNAAAPAPVITAITRTIHAGTAVHVHALDTRLNAGTPLTARYDWDFGDSGARYNWLRGFSASHIYERPGTYTLTLRVMNEGRHSASTSITINVLAPSRRVIYVSAAGSDSNDGTASRPIRTFAKASSMVADNTEILFRRGDTFTLSSAMSLSGRKNVVIGAYGSGNRPILRYTGSLQLGSNIITTGTGGEGQTIRGLTFDTMYTSGHEGIPMGIRVGGTNVAIVDNAFRNVSDAINMNLFPRGVMVQQNVVPTTKTMRGYFAWVQGSDIVVIGNDVADSLYSHVLRSAGFERLLIAYNNFTNYEDPVIKSTLNIQKGQYAYTTGNVMSEGTVSFGPLGGADGLGDKGARTRWVVVENNRINAHVNIEHGAEHLMMRNNIVYREGAAIEIQGYSSTYGRGVVNATIANNTVVTHGDKGNFLKLAGTANGVRLVNNLYLAPNLVIGAYQTAPVYVANSGLGSFSRITGNVWSSPRILEFAQGGFNYVWPSWSSSAGYKTPAQWEAYSQVGKDHYQNTPVSSSLAPSSSSQAATAGTAWLGVFDDVNGRTRPSTGWITAGAVQL